MTHRADELFETEHWYACRTRARAEKAVHRTLEEWKIGSYLPLVVEERQWADRKKQVAFPLLPGYVFARFQLKNMLRVLRIPGVASIVQTNGHPTPVRDEEMELVRQVEKGVLETGVPPSIADCYQEGQAVEIVEGPFKGIRGTLVEDRGRAKVCIRLSSIEQAILVDVPRATVRPLSPSRDEA